MAPRYTPAMLLPGSDTASRRVPLLPLLIVLAGVAASLYTFHLIDRSGREEILRRATTLAVAVPRAELSQLSGSPADEAAPAYAALKSFFAQVREADGEARFLYLMGRDADGGLFFYVDSEPAGSADESPPGQAYDEATPAMRALFSDAVPRTEGPDRDRWGLWISGYAPVQDAEGRTVAMLGIDLPAERYLRDALAYALLPLLLASLLAGALAAAERRRRQERAFLEHRAEFLSVASHEIRTPLTGIRWAVEDLLDGSLSEGPRSTLTLVHGSCVGLLNRVNNLLDLAKLDGAAAALRPEAIPVPEFVDDMLQSLTLSARARGVTLAADPSVAGAGAVTADRQMLHHALFNLLTNAIKYTRPDTRVTVSYEKTGGMHRFSIADQGTGIPPEERDRIFEGYHRTSSAARSAAPGSGIGLYLVRRAAERHGGTATVASGPEGSTFQVAIPDPLPPPGRSAPRPARGRRPGSGPT